MKKAEVRFEKITKKFNETVAVDNISCSFEAGTLTTLLGPSGCGKTTSLRIIAGLERATSGKILVDNEDVTLLPATDRDVSMVFQSYALFPHMSVIENVSYGLKMINVNKEEYIQKSIDTLKLVNLEGYENRMPSELSGGQQQRVAVARAIVLEPKVLLFDEPLSNLDAKLRRQVREDIREIQQKLGVTTIYVTHDQEEALAISDKVIVMNNAVIAQEGSPKELYNYPKNKFVANFIGDANVVRATITNKQSNLYDLKIAEMNLKVESNKEMSNSISPIPNLYKNRMRASIGTSGAYPQGYNPNIRPTGSKYGYSTMYNDTEESDDPAYTLEDIEEKQLEEFRCYVREILLMELK